MAYRYEPLKDDEDVAIGEKMLEAILKSDEYKAALVCQEDEIRLPRHAHKLDYLARMSGRISGFCAGIAGGKWAREFFIGEVNPRTNFGRAFISKYRRGMEYSLLIFSATAITGVSLGIYEVHQMDKQYKELIKKERQSFSYMEVGNNTVNVVESPFLIK